MSLPGSNINRSRFGRASRFASFLFFFPAHIPADISTPLKVRACCLPGEQAKERDAVPRDVGMAEGATVPTEMAKASTCWLPNRASTVLQGCEWSGVAVHTKSSLGHAALALLISSLVNPNSAPEKAVTESTRTSKQVTGPQFPAEPSLSSAPWAQTCRT